jgi:hypothetical protein
MRIWETLVGCAILSATLLTSVEAEAQTPVPPIVERDTGGWGLVSDISLALGTASVALMPRVYYADPSSTVGWKGRWHVSVLAPAMTFTAITILTEIPIKESIESARPGCSVEATIVSAPGSNCETFGGPSTHLFASWGVTGMGTGIFLVDTLKYSDGRFNVPAFIGNVAFPLVASIFTTIGRGVDLDEADTSDVNGNRIEVNPEPFENGGQLLAGALPGFFTGLTLGFAYAMLQRPSCPYGNAVICW